ncbi:MAG: hypothetical protein NTY39_07115 [Campylobacterales bacterium]|nr:hypothetical protein [Campylobacterales bacterium]
MNKVLEHPIISSVVASLILSFFSWLNGTLPTIWLWIKSIIFKLIAFFSNIIEVPLWLLLIICIPYVWWLVKKIISFITEKNYKTEILEQKSEPDNITLTDDEYRLLKLLVQKDGKPAQHSDFKYELRIPILQAEQMIESLSKLEFIEAHNNWMDGTQIFLSKKGRDFILGNKYIRT